MNVVIVCSQCKKALKIPVEGLGKKIRCPACQTVFVGRRDEFKPRTAPESEAAKAPPVRQAHSPQLAAPANDALLSEEDAAPDALAEAYAGTNGDDVLEMDDAPASRRTARKKKKSWLLYLLVLLVVLMLLAAAAGAGYVYLM